jgi:hypothetical protein
VLSSSTNSRGHHGAYLHLAYGIGRCRETLVDADKGFATPRLGQLERIGEIIPRRVQSNAFAVEAASFPT